jgi:23S rRNA (cytidine1920-2'-O)/16S rRNA (cytidine1409-2'-O)-methyltransferase
MPPAAKRRADELAVELGLAEDRAKAGALIMAGRVLEPDGRRVPKAGRLYPAETLLTLAPGRLYAGRGGLKLAGALDDLGLDPTALRCMDLGASTGGFTDCLLRRGAASVTAVEVGRGLIDHGLRQNPRLKLIEGVNARRLREPEIRELLGAPFDLATADLSFISLALILPAAAPLLVPGGAFLALVKPQFELSRDRVGKGGIVRDPSAVKEAADDVAALGPKLDPPLREIGRADSRLKGHDGNQEVFLLFRRHDPAI